MAVGDAVGTGVTVKIDGRDIREAADREGEAVQPLPPELAKLDPAPSEEEIRHFSETPDHHCGAVKCRVHDPGMTLGEKADQSAAWKTRHARTLLAEAAMLAGQVAIDSLSGKNPDVSPSDAARLIDASANALRTLNERAPAMAAPFTLRLDPPQGVVSGSVKNVRQVMNDTFDARFPRSEIASD
jgi:hypothetical protein